MSGTKEGAGLYDSLADELSYDQIQQMMDQLLGEESFGFADMVQNMIRNGKADTVGDLLHSFRKVVLSSFSSDRKMFVSLIAVALVGAVFSNFSKVLHGKEVAGTAFYIVYLLFFSILATSFLQIGPACRADNGEPACVCEGIDPGFFYQFVLHAGGRCSRGVSRVRACDDHGGQLAFGGTCPAGSPSLLFPADRQPAFGRGHVFQDGRSDPGRRPLRREGGVWSDDGNECHTGADHSGECRGQKHDDGAAVKLDTGCRQFGGECFADRFVCR